MRRYSLASMLLAGSFLFVGCNSESASTQTESKPDKAVAVSTGTPTEAASKPQSLTQSSDGHTSPAAGHVKASEPTVAVESFLTALQNEQGDVAFSLITGKARDAMHEFGLSPQPVGSKAATYTIGRTEFVTPEKDGAYVSSIWSEPLAEGEVDQYEIVWVLRKEATGWRIAGMASEVLPNEPPLFLDFENPGEMQRKLVEAERTIAAANGEPAVRQAQNVEPIAEPTELK